MKWVKDRSGRFAKRPHYEAEELDRECEALISDFLRKRHKTIEYPVSTDDLTILIESLVTDLDLYADLSKEEGEVEGVTDFFPGNRPKVRISQRLTNDIRLINRLRTTLTHELGHVKFHAFMFDAATSGLLFPSDASARSNKCKRDSMLDAGPTDWMEWQAGFCCGAFLMPATALSQVVSEFRHEFGSTGAIGATSMEAQYLIRACTDRFAVSRDAARVRLLQKGVLLDTDTAGPLFG